MKPCNNMPLLLMILRLLAVLGNKEVEIGLSSIKAQSFQWPDCPSLVGNSTVKNGPFFPVDRTDGKFMGSPLVVYLPRSSSKLLPDVKLPVVVFMHGLKSTVDMYLPNLQMYASHGFAVIFPYIRGPEEDRDSSKARNTDGEYIIRGIEYAKVESSNTKSPLFGRIDLENVIIAGHSMGATCSIVAGRRLAMGDKKNISMASAASLSWEGGASIRVIVAQHPGICGPFGPPPWPSTWMKSDLAHANSKFPVIFTTSTNDNAFWKAPRTAWYEQKCFEKALPAQHDSTSGCEDDIGHKNCQNGGAGHTSRKPAIFVQYRGDVCEEDGARAPFKDGGHNCPLKVDPGVETPVVLTAMKLYGQQNGSPQSRCHSALYGHGPGGILFGDKSFGVVEKVIVRCGGIEMIENTGIPSLFQEGDDDHESTTN